MLIVHICLSFETWRLDNDESKITLLKVTKNQKAGFQNGRIIEFNLSVLSFKSFQQAMLYWMEAVPVTSSHAKKLEVTDMKMCRWACGHTLRDHVRNDDIRDILKVDSIKERCRKARLRWFGHVKRRDHYVGRKTLETVPPGRRMRGRPNQRWMDSVNRDMRAIGTTKDEVHDRTGWRRIVSAAATPQPSVSG